MELINQTDENIDFLHEYVREYDTSQLKAYIKNTRRGANTPYSGVCYYKTGVIRVSVNPNIRYPLTIRVGSPFNKLSWRYYEMNSFKEVVSFVFLHELSHYLDYRSGVSVRCKQTKADYFALKKMGRV